MKELFEQVIQRREYDLKSLLTCIDQYHIEGKLTDDERQELTQAAREGAAAEYDYKGEIEPIVARRLPAHEIEQGICHAAEHARRYSSSPQAEFTHEGRRKRGDYVIRQTREKAAKQAV